MPESFEKCVNNGGRVKRISGPDSRWNVPADHYMNICWDKENKPHRGYVHKMEMGKEHKEKM